ncbi:PREDICTED: bromodomain adjacent to zinc finger domain protein 1A-like [Acropora digitifera]|uniref:bromodomain adjacent to zinc finger domain protein 1A-like n=1 Tax=Acropora digitifera TaxID=70779 RepID=UPI00077AC458|nr:PREDICTED: bromodomain adjacent to zinc finger domain protein 1A-like [Acropora digitifera]
MPLLNRKPFSPTKPPKDLKPDEEVFVCRHTNEVFRDYGSFFERTILCNSLLWSCKYTGKSGLTFQEARASEKSVRKQGKSLPESIQRAVVTLVHHTQRGRLANLCDDVFSYLKDHFQEGEEVEINYQSHKKQGVVIRVIPPEEVSNYSPNKSGKPAKSRKHSHSEEKLKSPSLTNCQEVSINKVSKQRTGSSSSSDSQPLSLQAKKSNSDSVFDKSPTSKSPRKSVDGETPSKGRRRSATNSCDKTPGKSRKHSSDDRGTPSKATSSDEKAKKLSTPSSRKSSEDKLVSPKNKSPSGSNVLGSPHQSKKTPSTKTKKSPDTDIALFLDDGDKKGGLNRQSPKLSSPKEKPVCDWPDASLYKYEVRLTFEKKSKGPKTKEKRYEVLTVQASMIRYVNKLVFEYSPSSKRPVQDLPKAKPVQIKLPSDLFGDMMMVLEFLNVFGNLFDIKDEFPNGLSFAMLEEALTEHDAEGVYYDLLLFLLGAILRTHLEEEEEEGLDGTHDHEPVVELDDDGNEKSGTNVSAAVSMAAAWPMQFQGKPLHELIMDPFTSSELLRLHLLSSGARIVCYLLCSSVAWPFSICSILALCFDLGGLKSGTNVSAAVSMAAAWPMQFQGKPLHELIMDPFTSSELLRLHLLSSGARIGCGESSYRWQRRGGFTYCDDAGVEFRHDAPHILKSLVTSNVYDMGAEDKLKVLVALCTQLITYATARDCPFFIIAVFFISASKTESAKNEVNQLNKGGKAGKKKDENLNSSQSNESKESTNTDNQTAEEKKSTDPLPAPLTKEEEEELAQQRKDERKRKDQDFLNQLAKAVSRSAIQPLGRDRVFRRYWTFKSLRGLFVEDDDPDQHLLLEPELKNPDVENGDEQEDEETEQRKQNDKASPDDSLTNGHKVSEDERFKRKVLNILSAYQLTNGSLEKDFGDLYKKRPVVKWSYFSSKEDLDTLLDALNPRGYRERHLRDAIQQDYKQLALAVEKCPLKEDIQAQKKEAKGKGRRGGRNQVTVDKSRYKTMEEFLEANLRDQILDLEDRIWQGNLGSITGVERIEWRSKVENGIYGQFIEQQESKGAKVNGVDGGKQNGDDQMMDLDGSCDDKEGERTSNEGLKVKKEKEETPMECDEDQKPVINGVKEEGQSKCNTDIHEELDNVTALPLHLQLDSSQPSSPGTNTSTRCSTPSLLTGSAIINPAVKELALELLKVEEGIERKYLNPPLGEDEETKRQKQKEAAVAARNEFNEMMKVAENREKQKKDKKKENDGAESKDGGETKTHEQADNNSSSSSTSCGDPGRQKTSLERWEESLLTCTNLSQVFVHLNTLDQSVAWSKSVLNARCRLCKRKGDAEHMLLCDGCDRGHHMYCLKPPIKEVPEGHWFCSDCRPKETRRGERRKRPAAKDEEDDDEHTNRSEEGSNSVDEASDDEEDDSESESESDENGMQSDASARSEHGDQCAVCSEGGELLCCDTCPLAYHIHCAYPPLRRIPRGNWACQVCTGADDERPRSCRVKKATIEGENYVACLSNWDKLMARRRVRTSIDSSRSSSPAVRPRSKKPTGRRAPKLTAKFSLCDQLLEDLINHEDSWPFLEPVDLSKNPDYRNFVQRPIDLGTIKNNLSDKAYESVEDFASDVRQVFINCSEYCKPRGKEARAGVRLSAFFETHLTELGLDASEGRTTRSRRT